MSVTPSKLTAWGHAPDCDIRMAKREVEKELMKVQAVRTDEIQLNPLILYNRLDRPRAHVRLNYSRAHYPWRESTNTAFQVTMNEPIPIKQLSNLPRRGPRDVILPNLIKQPVEMKLSPVPLLDTTYKERREAAEERLNALLKDWSVYHRIAHPLPNSRQSMLSDGQAKRKISRNTFNSIARGSAYRKESMVSRVSSSSGKKSVSFLIPRSEKKRNSWKFLVRETINHLHASRMKLPEELSKSELRIYVSSTPDLQEEREFLEEVAYPKIRELCEHIGLNCHMVDMRTGAGILTNNIETFDLIEKELRTCRSQSIGPCFVSIIGHELDDQSLPGFLYKPVFEEIREVLIKEKVVGVEALDDVYRLDSNRIPPVYIKQRIKAVDEYSSPEEVERVLHEALVTAVSTINRSRSKKDLGHLDTYQWSAVVKEIEEGLLTNHNPRADTLCLMLDPDTDDEVPSAEAIHRLRYNVVTHYKEYAARDNLIAVKSAKKNMAYLRYVSDTFVSGVTSLLKAQTNFIDYDLMNELTESSEVLQHVRLFLRPSTASIIDKLEHQIPSRADITSGDNEGMNQVINEANQHEIADIKLEDELTDSKIDDVGTVSKIEHEVAGTKLEHEVAGTKLEQEVEDSKFEDDDKTSPVMATIKQCLERMDLCPKTLLLWGGKGSGKTTLAVQAALGSLKWKSKMKIVVRRIGATLRSSSLFRLLESLINQLSFLYSLNLVMSIDLTLQEMVNLFCQTLRDVSVRRNIEGSLFLILDQVENCRHLNSHIMTYILDSLPEGVTLMLVVGVPSPLFDVIKVHSSTLLCNTSYLSADEFSQFLTRSLENVSRVITSDQHAAGVSSLPGDITPMCSQTVFHIVRWWPSHTLPSVRNFLGEPEFDLDIFLQTLESDLGVAFTRYSLSLLAAARHGLADQELLHLVSKDADLLSEIKDEEDEIVSVVEGFPYQLQMSRLMARLNCFVVDVKIEGETVHILATDDLTKAITTRYMKGDFLHAIHQRLANFFQFFRRGLLLSSRDIVEQKHKHLSKYHWRTMRCVLYHLTHSYANPDEVWKNLKEKVLFNFNWLVNEVYYGFFNELLDDISHALDSIDLDPEILSLQQLLVSVRHTVVYNPVSLAAILACIKTSNQEGFKDPLDCLIRDARLWLQQIHLQTLVPVSYTPGKLNRLLLKEKSLYGVSSIKIIPASDRLLVQRVNTLTILNTLTGEETTLLTLSSKLSAYHVVSEERVVILTSDSSGQCGVEICHLQKGKHEKTFLLGVAHVKWFNVVDEKTAYLATKDGFQCLDLDGGSIKTILSPNISWSAVCITGNNEKIVILKDELKLELFALRGQSESRFVSLKKDELNDSCQTLLATKDGKYVVCVTQKFATVVQCIGLRILSCHSKQDLTIVTVELSRSHEHVFLAFASGDINCYTLSSGKLVLETKLKAGTKGQGSRRHARSRIGSGSLKNITNETITVLITSEDDHFLFCGTTIGFIYVFHIPTGLHVVNINSRQEELVQMTFLTDRTHFQHLITTDKSGVSKQWNLRPLFKQARLQLQFYISDEDLRKEEANKIELNNYIHIYQDNVTNRIFLNGPDITAFYSTPPNNLFDPLAELDPDFGHRNDWEVSGALADIVESMMSLTCCHQLGDVILTLSNDFRLARWSLHDGSLIWSKKLSGLSRPVFRLDSVYFDQAVLTVEKSTVGANFRLTVYYTGDGQNKQMSRDNVLHYRLSAGRTHVLLLCQATDNWTVTTLYIWDLMNAKETNQPLTKPPHFTDDTSHFVLTSPNLTQIISVCLPSFVHELHGDVCCLHRGSTKEGSSYASQQTRPEISKSGVDKRLDGEYDKAKVENMTSLHQEIPNVMSNSTKLVETNDRCIIHCSRIIHEKSGEKKSNLVTNEERELENDFKETSLAVRISSLCCVNEETIFIGTASGYVCLLYFQIPQQVSILTKTGPRLVDSISEKALKDLSTPHKHWIWNTRVTEDSTTLISIDNRIVCVWNARNKNLVMFIELSVEEQITQIDVSKDAAIIALVANNKTVHLYTPLETREIASYRTTFTVNFMQMSCDCRKILLQGSGLGNRQVLEIFDVKNVDDILMRLISRKVSQQKEMQETLTNERLRKTSQAVRTDF